MSTKFDYDLIVIGAGSGGVRAARISAGYGAKVAIVEENRPGGTCVLRGCIPKKFLVYASQFNEEVRDYKGYGWDVEGLKHDWSRFNKAKNLELDRLAEIYRNILSNAGCKLFQGRASLKSINSVIVNGKTLTAEKILIATGGKSFVPNDLALNGLTITSDEALNLKKCPETIVIFGGGYIAVEFAGIFRGFGCNVHLVYRSDKPLRGFDNDIRSHLVDELTNKGIILHSSSIIDKIDGKEEKLLVFLSNQEQIKASQALLATGRLPNVKGLGLNNLGVLQSPNGSIIVDQHSKTNIETIFAIGDVTDRINLTPVALGEGHAFADREFGNKKRFFDYNNVPSAVFSKPPIACVGLSEDEAITKNIDIFVFSSKFNPLKNTLSGSGEKSYMKLIVEKRSNMVLGAHMIGVDSPEILQGLAIAIKAGLHKEDFDQTVGIHPTSAEEFVTMRSPRS